MLMGPLLLIVLVVNAAYCLRKILEDWTAGRPAMAGLGAVCLIGVNGLVGWLIYESLASSTDL